MFEDKIPSKFNFFKKEPQELDNNLRIVEDRAANLLMTMICSPMIFLFLLMVLGVKSQELKEALSQNSSSFQFLGLYIVSALSISDFIINFYKIGVKKKNYFEWLRYSFSLSFTNFLTLWTVQAIFWPTIHKFIL